MNDSVATDRMVLISTDYGDMKVENVQSLSIVIILSNSSQPDSTTVCFFIKRWKALWSRGGDPESSGHRPDRCSVTEMSAILFLLNLWIHCSIKRCCAARTENPEKLPADTSLYCTRTSIHFRKQMNMMEMQRRMALRRKSCFYSTIGGTPFLDHNYTVFGEV